MRAVLDNTRWLSTEDDSPLYDNCFADAPYPKNAVFFVLFTFAAPEASQFLLLLFVCMFTFCVLGVQLYGGLVSSDPESEAYKKISVSMSRRRLVDSPSVSKFEGSTRQSWANLTGAPYF